MNKHTPGPWAVDECGASGEVSEYHIFIEPSIAVIERKVKGSDQCDMADALLIAAAPDLLEALKGLISFAEAAETKMLVGDEGCLWPVEEARAAIAKAEGAA